MTTQLLYHSAESKEQNISPFDKAICDLVTDKDISIVCPYLGIDYLQTVLGLCNSWRLLTDVNAWLDAQKGNAKQLSLIQGFIRKNRKKIHHFPDIHAKGIFTPGEAFVGSANLTSQGVRYREEVSVLFKDEPQVSELLLWLNKLWSETECLKLKNIEDISTYITQYLDQPPQQSTTNHFIKLPRPKHLFTLNPHSAHKTENNGFQQDISVDISNKLFFTVDYTTSQLSKKETTKWDSIRRWIYRKIKTGEIQAYRFTKFYLLESEDVEELEQYRSLIHQGKKIRSPHTNKDVIEITNEQLLTLSDLSSYTGINQRNIQRMVDNKKIPTKVHGELYFAPDIIELVKSLPPEPSGHRVQAKIQKVEFVWLKPYSPLEQFVLDARDRDPRLSDPDLIIMARKAKIEGVTEKSGRELGRQNFNRAVSKKELFEEYDISSDELKMFGRIRISELKKRNRADKIHN